MNNYLRVLLLPLLLLTSYYTVNAQFGFDEDLVKLKVFSSFDNVHGNSELKIALKINTMAMGITFLERCNMNFIEKPLKIMPKYQCIQNIDTIREISSAIIRE